MVLDILQIGDPVLREKCSPVKKFDKELWKLLDDMKETLKKAEGAGLAAPQVGVPLRAVAVDVEEGYFELINPIFVWQKGEQSGPEGCLSVRGKVGDVIRPSKVKVTLLLRGISSPAPSAMNSTTSTACSIPTRRSVCAIRRIE